MAEIEVNFANLNFKKQALPRVTGARFQEFLEQAGYDGAEITQFRPLWMRRMLGSYAAEITHGLHAPFAGRTFLQTMRNTVTEINNPNRIKRNIKGLFFTAAMPEVSRGTAPMARFQEQIGKGVHQGESQFDAVLYPFSGDNAQPLHFNDESAPFRTRTFQLTAEVLHRWGLPVAQGAPNDELFEQMQERMQIYGFDAITLDGLHARRKYDKEAADLPAEFAEAVARYGLPEGYVEYVAARGLIRNFHISVGRTDVTESGSPLERSTKQESELFRSGNAEGFASTQQGEWAQLALEHYRGDEPFRMTVEWPNSATVNIKGKLVDPAQHKDGVAMLREMKSAA